MTFKIPYVYGSVIANAVLAPIGSPGDIKECKYYYMTVVYLLTIWQLSLQ